MSEQEPLVSIGMPVYNGANYLRLALDSLLAQTYGNFEIFVSDNASTDETPYICSEYALRDSRVTYVRRPQPLPIVSNFNSTLSQAKGKYFMWAAHDDLWEPEFIAALVQRLERYPAAVLAFCKYDNIDGFGRVSVKFKIDWVKAFSGPKVLQLCRFLLYDRWQAEQGDYIYGMFRTEILRNRGGLEWLPDNYGGCDFVTLFGLLTIGQFSIEPRVLFHYRFAYRDLAGVKGMSHGSAIAVRIRRHLGRFGRFLRSNRVMFGACHKHIGRSPFGAGSRMILHAAAALAEISSLVLCTLRIVLHDIFQRPPEVSHGSVAFDR